MAESFFKTGHQEEAVAQLFLQAKTIFPNLNNRQLVEGPLAEFAFGPLPGFSDLDTYKVTNVQTATSGAFILLYGYDPEISGYAVVVIQRHDKGPAGEDRHGVPGGYVLLGNAAKRLRGEQPAEGAIREASREEIVDDNGKPIFELTSDRLQPLMPSIDYAAKFGYPVHNDAFAVEMTEEEMKAIKNHCARLHADDYYRASVFKSSKYEVENIFVLPLGEAVKSEAPFFTYPHEFAALCELHTQLEARRPGSSIPAAPESHPLL